MENIFHPAAFNERESLWVPKQVRTPKIRREDKNENAGNLKSSLR